MLKLKLQCFGHLIQRADSLEKTVMLGKIEGRRRREWQRMRCLDGITDSTGHEFEQTPSVLVLSHVQLFATPMTVAHRAPLSMGFSRQEYWSGLPCPSPGDLPDPGIKPGSPTLQMDSLPSEPPGKPLMLSVTCTQHLWV